MNYLKHIKKLVKKANHYDLIGDFKNADKIDRQILKLAERSDLEEFAEGEHPNGQPKPANGSGEVECNKALEDEYKGKKAYLELHGICELAKELNTGQNRDRDEYNKKVKEKARSVFLAMYKAEFISKARELGVIIDESIPLTKAIEKADADKIAELMKHYAGAIEAMNKAVRRDVTLCNQCGSNNDYAFEA